MMNRLGLSIVFILSSLISVNAQPLSRHPDVIHSGSQALFGGGINYEDQSSLPTVEDYFEGTVLRVNSNLYMATTIDGASEWLRIGGTDSPGSGDEDIGADVVHYVTDTTTQGASEYEYTIPDRFPPVQFVPASLHLQIGRLNFTSFKKLLDGELQSGGDRSHRGFVIELENTWSEDYKVEIFYALEEFTGIDLAVLDDDRSGLSLATEGKLDSIGGMRR